MLWRLRWRLHSLLRPPPWLRQRLKQQMPLRCRRTPPPPLCLPRVNELRRLVNKRADPPGIDPELFPNAPQDWHWTGTANIKTFSVNAYKYDNVQQGNSDRSANQMAFTQGWAVDLSSGEARGDIAKSELLPVRLVRPRP